MRKQFLTVVLKHIKSLIVRENIQLNRDGIYHSALLWPVHGRLPRSAGKVDFVVFHTRSKKPDSGDLGTAKYCLFLSYSGSAPCSCVTWAMLRFETLGPALPWKSPVWLVWPRSRLAGWEWWGFVPAWKACRWKWDASSWLPPWASCLALKAPSFCWPGKLEVWLHGSNLLGRDPAFLPLWCGFVPLFCKVFLGKDRGTTVSGWFPETSHPSGEGCVWQRFTPS